MNSAYILRSPEEIIMRIDKRMQTAFSHAIQQEFFQNQPMNVTIANRDNLIKVVVSVISRLVAVELKHMADIPGIDKNKVKEMHDKCVEAYLTQLEF